MGRVNVYLPDDLHAAVKGKGLNVSQVCQAAIAKALGRDAKPEPDDPEVARWAYRVKLLRSQQADTRRAAHEATRAARQAREDYTLVLREAIAWFDAHTTLSTREIAAVLDMTKSLVSNVRTGLR